MKKYQRITTDKKLCNVISNIAKDTGRTKQASSSVIADFLIVNKKDLNSFVNKNKDRRKYEIRF